MLRSSEPRYAPIPPDFDIGSVWRCLDCGSMGLAEDQPAHTRFHSILSSHAWALAVLKNRHIGAHVHDRYDVVERISSRKFDNWSADALAEVIRQIDEQEAPDGP